MAWRARRPASLRLEWAEGADQLRAAARPRIVSSFQRDAGVRPQPRLSAGGERSVGMEACRVSTSPQGLGIALADASPACSRASCSRLLRATAERKRRRLRPGPSNPRMRPHRLLQRRQCHPRPLLRLSLETLRLRPLLPKEQSPRPRHLRVPHTKRPLLQSHRRRARLAKRLRRTAPSNHQRLLRIRIRRLQQRRAPAPRKRAWRKSVAPSLA
jgi:hypothetical protein